MVRCRYKMLSLIVMGLLVGCSHLTDEEHLIESSEKSRETWSELPDFPNAQDIAILIPRDEAVRLRASDQNSLGERLLPEDWINTIGDAFLNTPVEDAFTAESWYEDWQAASVRISPCSPLLTTPGPGNDVWCWPEMRIVWQPTMYNIRVGWSSLIHPAYSDDRGVHVLYDILPRTQSEVASQLISQVRNGDFPDPQRFTALRNAAITQSLNRMVRLRGVNTMPEAGLYYHQELITGPAAAHAFLEQFIETFDDVLMTSNVHTVTAFSLPEGRQPSTIDIWSFLAFSAKEGRLSQKSIEIIDPNTGLVVGQLSNDETVSMGSADHRLVAQIEAQGEDSPLKRLVLTDAQDRTDMKDQINDPEQTLIPNTSCATCHSMNELAFDLHNLSYFEQEEITISPRVVEDVRSELSWIREWIQTR